MRMDILNLFLLLSGNLFITHCNEDVFYHHPTLPIQCAKCERGEKVKNYCSIDKQNSVCVECEEGTFANVLSSSKFCEKCLECIYGQIIKKECTSKKNTKCQCPDNKYYHHTFCKDCSPPKIKTVRDDIEYCEDCKAGSYYNNTSQKCLICDTCTEYQHTVHSCNVTHNTQCRYLSVTIPSTTEVPLPEKDDAQLSAGEKAGIIIGIISVLVICVLVFYFYRKKLFCFKEKNNQKSNGEAPHSQDQESRATSSSTPFIPTSGNCETSISLNSTNPTASGDQEKRSSMPHWLSIISNILSDNLGETDLFILHLRTDKFNATAKFQQLKDFDLEVRISKFLDKWYEQNPRDANLRRVIAALEYIDKNDIVQIIKCNVELKEKLIKENIIDADFEEPNFQFPAYKEKKKYPIQVTNDSMLANLLIPDPDVLSMRDMLAPISHNQDTESRATSSSTPFIPTSGNNETSTSLNSDNQTDPSVSGEQKKRSSVPPAKTELQTYPTQVTNDDDSVNHSLLQSDMDSMDNRGMQDSEEDLVPFDSDQTKAKRLICSDPDKEQTSSKQLISSET